MHSMTLEKVRTVDVTDCPCATDLDHRSNDFLLIAVMKQHRLASARAVVYLVCVTISQICLDKSVVRDTAGWAHGGNGGRGEGGGGVVMGTQELVFRTLGIRPPVSYLYSTGMALPSSSIPYSLFVAWGGGGWRYGGRGARGGDDTVRCIPPLFLSCNNVNI